MVIVNDSARPLTGEDIYSNYTLLVRQASKKFKRLAQQILDIRLKDVTDEGALCDMIKQGKLAEGTLVLKGTFNHLSENRSIFAGFDVKNGVLNKTFDTVCDENGTEYPLSRKSRKAILGDEDDFTSNLGGKAIGILRGAGRFIRKAQADVKDIAEKIRQLPPAEKKPANISPLKFSPELKKLHWVEGIPQRKMDVETEKEVRNYLSKLDSIMSSAESIRTSMKTLQDSLTNLTSEQKKIGDEIYTLLSQQNLDAIFDLGDKIVQILTRTEENKEIPVATSEVIKILRMFPEIDSLIKEAENKLRTVQDQIKPEISVVTPEKKAVKGQSIEGNITSALTGLKDSLKKLFLLVTRTKGAVDELYDETVLSTSLPSLTPRTELAKVFGSDISKPTTSGLSKIRRQANKRVDRNIEAWDASSITDEEVIKIIDSSKGKKTAQIREELKAKVPHYNRDSSEKELEDAYEIIDNLLPEAVGEEKRWLSDMLQELSYYWDLQTRDKELEEQER